MEGNLRSDHLWRVVEKEVDNVSDYTFLRRLMEVALQLASSSVRERVAEMLVEGWRSASQTQGEDRVWKYEEFTRLYGVLGGKKVRNMRQFV